ncbi:MAG: hypothetical protein V1676_03655 [Candidatus Diapherotrites archaeon]
MISMAKPIRATPTLVGDEAVRFLDRMKKKEAEARLTKSDRILLDVMHKNEKLFSSA